MSLRFVLLALLSKGPDTGYGMGRALHHELSYLWDARLQQIYGELAKLQSEGMVETRCVALANRPAKKVYSLSAAGEQALDRYLLTPPASHSNKDRLSVRLFCLERLPAEVAVRWLEQRHDDCANEAATLRQQLVQTPRTEPARLGNLLTLEAALSRVEAEAAWCERAVATLREEPEASPAATDVALPQQRRVALAAQA